MTPIHATDSSSDAPYTLVQIDAAKSSTVPPLHISWHDISVSIGAPKKKTKTTSKQQPSTPLPVDEPPSRPLVLQDVSGEAIPGELLAIMGPSRAATFALVQTIAGQASPSAMTGSVRINGEPSSVFRSTVAFVPRTTPMYPTLTVQEQLTLQARLRQDDETNLSEVATRVDEVMAETSLTSVAQTLTDDGLNGLGLSARDRKLVPLAMQLLTNPSVLLIEDPLNGLNHPDAEEVVNCLQSLARKGRTVVMTASLENATSAMFGIFDKIHLLASVTEEEPTATACGYTVFHGKPVASLAFFETHGLTCPPLTNPFEFFARHLTTNEKAKDSARVTQLVHAWSAAMQHSHPSSGTLPTLDTSMLDPACSGDARQLSSLGVQLSVLMRRFVLRVSHDKATVIGRLRQSIIVAIIVGLLFLRLDVTQNHVQSLSTACFFIAASQFMSNVLPELSSAPKEVTIVLHDHKNRLYHTLSWYVVKNVSELPFQVVYPLFFLVPAYFLMGFPADVHIFFTFFLFTFLLVSTAIAIGLFAACVAPNTKKAFVIGIALIAPAMVFGGPFMNRKTTHVYFLWLQQISPVKYCYHGLMRAFWNDVGTIYCPPNTLCRATSGQSVLAMNVIHNDKMVSDVLIMLAINLALRVLGGLALWRRAAALTAARK